MNGGIRFSLTPNVESLSSFGDSDLPLFSNPLGYSIVNNIGGSASFSATSKNIQNSTATKNYFRGKAYGQTSGGDSQYGRWSDEHNYTIIDDDEVRDQQFEENGPSETNEQAPTLEELSSPTGIAEETGVEASQLAAETVEVAESSTPWGLAAIINQQIGQGVNSILTSQSQNVSSQDYMQNINQHGVNVGLNASLIQNQQEQTIRNQQSYGNFGSILGPVGTLIGHAIAGTVQANPSIFNTAASSSGWINPTDTVAANSASSATQSGQSTMIDNVDQ
nr:hypothetical protein [buhirugu virus 17]